MLAAPSVNKLRYQPAASKWMSDTYSFTAPSAFIVRSTHNVHIPELSKEAAQLVRHETQNASPIFSVRVARIDIGRWSRGVYARFSSVRIRLNKKRDQKNPSGCCMSETSSSTAVEEAIEAKPGRVTVHIWSRVRSVKD
jgi:endogenous inhibitor of DNA gyrase (YacG/DUF329 family)